MNVCRFYHQQSTHHERLLSVSREDECVLRLQSDNDDDGALVVRILEVQLRLTVARRTYISLRIHSIPIELSRSSILDQMGGTGRLYGKPENIRKVSVMYDTSADKCRRNINRNNNNKNKRRICIYGLCMLSVSTS